MRKLLAAASAAFVVLAGCGGGGGSTPPAQAPVTTGQPPATSAQSARVSVIVGGRTAGQSNGRRPKFVSPSTNGIDIQVSAHGGNTIIGESRTDISSGSAACGGQTGTPRTCTIDVPAPPGNDDFIGTTYDAAPVSNSFSAAHVLGRGALTSTIVGGSANALTLYISGVITALGYLAPNASLAADGAVHNLGFVLNPSDYGNNPITAGSNDPYSNPVSVQLTESGGSGHVQIVKNGTPTGGTSTSLNFSTDTVAVRYDGGGASGYSVTVSVSATNVTPETLTISPLYVTSASPFRSGSTLTFNATGQTAQVNLSETGAPVSTAYQATPSASCAGVATASAPTGPANAASTTVTAGSNGGSCTIAFTDGASTITWSVVVSTTSGTVTVPGNTVGPITFASYSLGAVRGQNGWLSNSCSNSDYNANVVNTSSYPSASWPGTPPSRALQIDNSVTQGCFSGLGSPPTAGSAGYPNALADTSTNPPGQCGPTCNPFFSVEFLVTSATGAWQPALGMSISPVWTNQGARMQYIGLWHTTDSGSNQKLLVFTNDVEGVVGGPAPCFQCANFVPWEIKYVDPALPHKIGMTMQFVQPNADVVKFYVDGVLAGVSQQQFRSWEDYYLFDTESDPGNAYPYSRAVNDLLFHPGNLDTCLNFADYQGNCNLRTSGPGHTSTANNGFLFTNITTCAGTQSSCAGAIQTSGVARSVQVRTRSNARPSGAVRGVAQLR
ncbi:MAG: hypothetical protein QOD51_2629 [Candidatus Eremiobacteraeota bacterium]|nr:hypothetical protein [Candidatus Eremiobacteraeota bacterium]